jgi:hypothetical protein
MANLIDPAVAKLHLQKQLREVAKDLLHRVYGPGGIPWGTRFTEIEEVAVQLGHAVSLGMIEEGLTLQAAAGPAEPETCGCGEPVEPMGDTRPRLLSTRAGQAQWDEPKRYCRRCRAAFFPSGPRAGD